MRRALAAAVFLLGACSHPPEPANNEGTIQPARIPPQPDAIPNPAATPDATPSAPADGASGQPPR